MKILWSFEPAGLSSQEIQSLHSLIRRFVKKDADLTVSHVEGEIYAGAADPYGLSAVYLNERDVKSEVESALKAAQISLSKKQLVYLSIPVTSVTEAIRRTLQIGAAKKADAIALFTHSKKGIERFIAGSFAETMIHLSSKDLILMSPASEESHGDGPLVFMDDFSNESKANLKKTVSMAKMMGKELIVFHVPHLAYKSPLNADNKWVIKYRKMVDQRIAWIEETAHGQKVKVHIELGDSKSPIVESVLKSAKSQKALLIVVAAKIGRLGSLLGGSVTRQLVRKSTVPVYVIKSKSNFFMKKRS